MTPISEMTNEQLDRWIAEKRGWTRRNIGTFDATKYVWYAPGEASSQSDCPHPTTDPRYAFELLEEMGEGVALEHSAFYHKWAIGLVDDDNYFVTADTPCRAIAVAWAEWRGGE